MNPPVAVASHSDIQDFSHAAVTAAVQGGRETTATASAEAWMPRRLLGGLAALSFAGVASAFPGDGLVPPAASAAAAFGGMLAFVLVLAAAVTHRRLRED
jgi:peptidoglycan/LPS O-acetylase OafA/YrhL